MSKKTYIKGVEMIMLSGDIRLLSDNTTVSYSTKQLSGVKQLDRQRFVKPVDFEQLALNKTLELDFKGRDAVLYSEGIMAGYNANKGVYTEEQLVEALEMNSRGCTRKEIISYLHPLSLPESVTIENDEIIDVVW